MTTKLFFISVEYQLVIFTILSHPHSVMFETFSAVKVKHEYQIILLEYYYFIQIMFVDYIILLFTQNIILVIKQ